MTLPVHRWWLAYLLIGLAAVAAGPWLPEVGQAVLYAVLGLAVIGAVLGGLRLHRPARPLAWRLLLLAMSVAVLANVGWAVEAAVGGSTAGLTVTDVFYLLLYPLLAACLAILPVHGRYGTPLAGMTEAGIVACVAAVLSWTLLVDPLINDAGALPRDVEIVAYPVLDLLILVMAVRMALVTGTRAHSHVLIVLTAFTLLTADTAFFVSVSQGGASGGTALTVSGWALANVLMGAGALHPSMATVARTGTVRARRTVSLPVFVTLVLLSPALTAVFVVHEMRSGGLDLLDVLVPSAATMITCGLLVVRLGQLTGVAQRRATDLDARTGELEDALRRQAVLQEQLTHQALHDPLTGLPNRALVHQRIGEALAGPAEPGALLMFDLDGFKDVNDRYGHPAGDALLIEVGRRVRAEAEPAGMLARLGGDEFAVLLRGPADAAALGLRILAALHRPVDVDGRQLHVSASIGLRLLAGVGSTAEAVRDADLALYTAKAAGKDQLAIFDDTMRQEAAGRDRLVEELRAALDTGEFVLHHQPLVRLADRRTVGVEALVRWQRADGTLMYPAEFVPAAEAGGLIVPLGTWVLRRACADAVGWYHTRGTTVSVNVSPRQLREPDFAAVVLRILAETGLPAPALCLEVTEGVLAGSGAHAERAVQHLRTLRRHGVRVALDDFGTGWSSLAYLRELPIDELKIDRSFLPAGTGDAQRLPLVRAIVEMAGGLGLTTVAEGVDDPDLAGLLTTLGCDLAQGYHLARPVPAAQVPALLAATAPAPVG